MWDRVGAVLQEMLRETAHESLSPFYDPPYDSPIEDYFAWHAVKYLASDCVFEKQVWALTICGRFRLDFVATSGQRRVAFECDGAQYHNPRRDECRDAVILWSGAVDAVYRFRGSDILAHPEDLLALTATRDPELFSAQGRRNLSHLMSTPAREWSGLSDGVALVRYRAESDAAEPQIHHLDLERRERCHGSCGPGLYLRHFYEFALEHGGGNLDTMIDLWLGRKSHQVG